MDENERLEAAGKRLAPLIDLTVVLRETRTPLKQAIHLDRLMVAVREVTPDVFEDLAEAVYPAVTRLGPGLRLLPFRMMADDPEGTEVWEAVNAWQTRHNLLGGGVENYVWVLLQAWEQDAQKLTALDPNSYVAVAYGNEQPPTRNRPPHPDPLVEFERQAHRGFFLAKLAFFLRGIFKDTSEGTLAYLGRPDPAGAARKDRYRHYRWLALYQCASFSVNQILDTLDTSYESQVVWKALRDTSKQCGLSLRRVRDGLPK